MEHLNNVKKLLLDETNLCNDIIMLIMNYSFEFNFTEFYKISEMVNYDEIKLNDVIYRNYKFIKITKILKNKLQYQILKENKIIESIKYSECKNMWGAPISKTEYIRNRYFKWELEDKKKTFSKSKIAYRNNFYLINKNYDTFSSKDEIKTM